MKSQPLSIQHFDTLVKSDFLILGSHYNWTAQKLYWQRIRKDHSSRARTGFLHSCKQLIAVPYLRVVCESFPLPREETMPAVSCLLPDTGQVQFPVCTSLTPRPITMVFGLGMRLHVHNRLQPGSAMNQRKFEAVRLWVVVELHAVVSVS